MKRLFLKLVPNSIKHKKTLAKHKGDVVECPICQMSFDSWYSIGVDTPVLIDLEVTGAGKRNAGCWNCHSIDRNRLIFLYFRDLSPIDSGAIDVLHIAPDTHVSKLFLNKKNVNYIRGDKFMKGYTYPKGVINLDLLHLEFQNDSFDLIICNHVLEHIPDDRKAISEIYRVLKPGGKAIIQVPHSKKLALTLEDSSVTTEAQRIANYGQFDHLRLYGRDYADRFIGQGFEFEALNICSLKPSYAKFGLNPNEDIFIAKKL